MPILSLVIPSYNEEKLIMKMATIITQLLKKENIQTELIFVNDGSKDNTWQEIEHASKELENVRGICLSRNFGKEAAILAGLESATGDCCVVMDSDLQHPPETVIQMYRLWENGFEIVEGVKKSRGKEGRIHKLCATLFYRLINRATGFDLSASSDFKLLDRKVVDAYLKLPERKLFFRALSFWLGYKNVIIEYEVQERLDGETKWSYYSLIKYAVNNITSFSTAPMQIITIIGLLFFGFATVIGAQSLFNFLSGYSLEGFTTVILLVLIIGSFQMLSLGIIGFYLSKIYEEVKRRPRYIVSLMTENGS